jgi:hypothetical protein
MPLPRAFVGYSSSDIGSYQLMKSWRETEGIDFDFHDCQLHLVDRNNNEAHVKEVCRARIIGAGAYLMLIGEDTFWKDRYVQWEAHVARMKGCRMIGVNLNHKRCIDPALTPEVLRNSGAMFVPFSPLAVQAAMGCDVRRDQQNYELTEEWYEANGFELVEDTARRIQPQGGEGVLSV